MPEKSEKIEITATRAKISKIPLIALTMGLGVFITWFILNLLTFITTREELFMTQLANYQLRLGIQMIKFENDSLKNENDLLKRIINNLIPTGPMTGSSDNEFPKSVIQNMPHPTQVGLEKDTTFKNELFKLGITQQKIIGPIWFSP